VSVDIEDGYSDDPDQVADYVAELAEAGVAGVNIDDSTSEALVEPDLHAAKLTAIKQRAPEVFLNARVDTYWLGQEATPESTRRRAEHYVAAGADGVFTPGASEPELLAMLAAALPVPLNMLVLPGRSLTELAGLGVRRVSTGSMPYRAALYAAVTTVTAVAEHTPVPSSVPYPELQERLRRFPS
jgi:2-methylisocitrate lyase-like PEP mutase family enzyme